MVIARVARESLLGAFASRGIRSLQRVRGLGDRTMSCLRLGHQVRRIFLVIVACKVGLHRRT